MKKIISIILVIAVTAVLLSTTAFAATTGTVNVTSGGLNVRQSPSSSSAIIGWLAKDSTVTIVETLSGWYKINYKTGYGYVSATYIKTATVATTAIGTVMLSSGALNLRSAPNTSASIIGWLYNGNQVTILGLESGFYKISFGGKTGYASAKYIVNNKAIAALNAAKSTLGVKYVYGGTTTNGFDCSGMTQYAYGKAGVTLLRTSSQQATMGVPVSRADLKIGDLVFFDTNGGNNDINHVGIYSGNNNFISALSGAGMVKEQSMSYAYWSNAYMTARRVVQ